MTKTQKRFLNDWAFTQIGGGQATVDGEWIQVSSFPTTVHVELLKQGKIPDPFVGLNEWDVQWVGESSWSFKTEFDVSDSELQPENIDLVFEGLDTFASVKLNGKEILSAHNQFLSYAYSVKSLLKSGKNVLVIDFESAFLKGRDIEKQHEKLNLWNGDSSRLHVRKAQYNYGWDWGPVLMTVGPWKPIYIESYTNSISDLFIKTDVSEALDVNLAISLSRSEHTPGGASVTLKAPDGSIVGDWKRDALDDKNVYDIEQKFEAGRLQLWYPVGYGKQPLYTVEATILDTDGEVLDSKIERIAFRRARIVQDPVEDEEGRTFLFEINNVRLFCGGSNWIPGDSFLTTMTKERYRAWLKLLVDGNQNMIRVWGGGIYEDDEFYNICDELGILVWQDFMFGCGQYPAYDDFVISVQEEATQAVKRLRHHPSIVIFAGNNEDYQVAESLNLELDYSDETSDFRKTNFPARYIYERILPQVVSKYSQIFYHRSSPYSGFGKDTRDKFHGDLHQWNVWHGTQEPWHNWDKLAGRFVSEFGMEAYPDIRTVDAWLGDDKSERFPQSRVNVNHNKADGFERRLELYLMENFKHAFDMESYVYYTQVMQAETLASAYRLWRRNWRGTGKEYTAGALVWQINDCWPTTSWAIVDYYLRPKPAYFAIARELRPFTVGMTRKEIETFADDRTAANLFIDTRLEIWATNSTLEEAKVTLEVTSFELSTDWKDIWTKEVILAPNASTEVWKGNVPGQPRRTKRSDIPRTIIVSARLLDASNKVLARYANWPEPFKYIKFPEVASLGLKTEIGADGESVTLSTKKPIKGIILDVDGDEVKWGDQAIDLVPEDPQTVKAVGLAGRQVRLRFLGDGSA
ncbi:glycoside hydrolase family 2 protein [Cylindrobasidium torrendii FP15055 ss-10]|uniref:Beta-mannosidase B n=1 Tax=Cylindrobasidium torrendii FP15055 ss-10 TaxID=1314674 RepID=A0A0D7BU26_9AGAR|nr:glycoside hydrolase family 2 protein [Cylindrobasidium torrendii FP15055 ss-10]